MSLFKRALATTLAILLSLSLGTFAFAATAVEIDTLEEFLSMTTGTYTLTADIDLGNTPRSSALIDSFVGTLDGNGHTISGLNVTSDRAALFGELTSGATVKNLVVKGIATAVGSTAYAGGIVAVNSGTIDNCASFVTVTGSGDTMSCVGGIVGYNNKGTVSLSLNHGDVTATGSPNGAQYVGGIVGAYGTVTGCVNNGTLVADGSETLMSYAGGISAYDTAVKLSENNGSVTAKGGFQSYAGGIVGFLDSSSYTITQTSANNGDVTATLTIKNADEVDSNVFATAGGVAGYLAGGFSFTDKNTFDEGSCTSIVRNCLNSGAVKAQISGSDKAKAYAAGIAANVNGLVYNCVNTATSFAADAYGPVFASINSSGILRGKIRDSYTITAPTSTVVGNIENTVADYLSLDDTALKTQSSYTTLDFNNTWAFDNGPTLVLPEHTHYSHGKTSKPSCTENTVTTFTCALCLETSVTTNPDSAIGHAYDNGTVTTEPTCDTPGEKTFTCANDAKHTYTEPVVAKGHSYSTEWSKDAGNHWHACTNDSKHIKDKAAHTFGTPVYNNDATTSADGTQTSTCTTCNYKKTETAAGTKLPKPQPQIKFTDVKDGQWYTDYVYYAAEHGLLTGTSATTFEPNTKLNRATFVTILAKVDGVYETLDKTQKTAFKDVKTNQWYTGSVAWAVKVGVSTGTSETTFEPMKDITREQMCTMLLRYANYKNIKFDTSVNAKETFKDDAKISSWAKEAVYACQMAGIVNGLGDGKFGPTETATRAQAAKIFSEFHKSYLVK